MKVLVLGGTGAMGSHLCSLLEGVGAHVFITSRSQLQSVGKIHYLQGNAKDDCFLTDILREQWDVIVDFMVYDTKAFAQRVDRLLSSCGQYIFLSTSRVYAESSSPITETSPRLLDACKDHEFLDTEEYALTKARQEDILFNSIKKNWTIIRPYITYGEERLQLGVLEKEGWMYRALRGRTIIFSSDIAERTTTLTYGLDVANGIQSLIGNQKALGEAYHITANDSLRWKDVLAIYLEMLELHLGHEPGMRLLDLADFTECHPAKYQIYYDRMYDRQFDNRKIEQFLNVAAFTRPEIGLRNCFRHFLQNPRFQNIDWKAEAMKDRKTGDRTPLAEISRLKSKFKYLLFRHMRLN